MTEKRFTSSYNGDESLFTHFLENGKPMTKQEVLNRLNELPEKNKLLLRKNGAMEEEIECLSDENEQLKKQINELKEDVPLLLAFYRWYPFAVEKKEHHSYNRLWDFVND